jgi:hypothetical protein
MIWGLFKDAVSWFVSLTEAGVVIAVILLIGVVAGMTAFWILGRGVRKLAGPVTELDPYENEPGAHVVPIRPDEDPPPSKLEP